LAGGICACRGGWLRLDCSAFVMKMSILGNTSELSDFGGPTATLTVRVAEIAGILQVPTSLVTCVATCSPSTEAVVQGSKLIFKPNATLVTAKLLGVVSHRTHPSIRFPHSHSMHSQHGLPLGGCRCALVSMARTAENSGQAWAGRAGRGSTGLVHGRWVPEVACTSRSVQRAACNIRHNVQCAA
jgi:hypothetical protein